jgi:hypothetical protein
MISKIKESNSKITNVIRGLALSSMLLLNATLFAGKTDSTETFPFEYLPPELQVEVLSLLGPRDLARSCRVSQYWNAFINEDLTLGNFLKGSRVISQLTGDLHRFNPQNLPTATRLIEKRFLGTFRTLTKSSKQLLKEQVEQFYNLLITQIPNMREEFYLHDSVHAKVITNLFQNTELPDSAFMELKGFVETYIRENKFDRVTKSKTLGWKDFRFRNRFSEFSDVETDVETTTYHPRTTAQDLLQLLAQFTPEHLLEELASLLTTAKEHAPEHVNTCKQAITSGLQANTKLSPAAKTAFENLL